MASGGWKRKLGWALAAVLAGMVSLAATWRAWLPGAVRLGLKTRGVRIQKIAWKGTDSWQINNLEIARDGVIARARDVTVLTPWVWKKALRTGATNFVFVTVNGWRIILAENKQLTPNTNSIAKKIQSFSDGVRRARAQCPNAVFLNGTIQSGSKEFNFASIQWKDGELSGDLTWPMLNDPADFRLKILDDAKTQFILKQTALEIGARLTSEVRPDGSRLFGYARWKTNRADLVLNFVAGESLPRNGFIESKGLAIPGRFLGMPEAESLNTRMKLVITNGRFDFRLGSVPRPEASEITPSASE